MQRRKKEETNHLTPCHECPLAHSPSCRIKEEGEATVRFSCPIIRMKTGRELWSVEFWEIYKQISFLKQFSEEKFIEYYREEIEIINAMDKVQSLSQKEQLIQYYSVRKAMDFYDSIIDQYYKSTKTVEGDIKQVFEQIGPQTHNPKATAEKPIGFTKVSYNEAIKKAFDRTTDSLEAKRLQRALILARNEADRKLKRKTPVPLWAYTFNLYIRDGKLTRVGYSDQL